jgi:mannitol-specific phosphotransferase system IIBC component
LTWEVKFPSQFFLEEIMSSIMGSEVKKICLACEAGAGSSLMVKNGLIKKAKKAGLDVEIVHAPATQIPTDSDIVVCHTGLAGAAKNAAPEGSVLIQFTMFMNDPNLKKLIVDLSEDNEITSS